jgi:hypothetical protein
MRSRRIPATLRLMALLPAAGLILAAFPSQGKAQSWRSVTMSRQLSGERDLDVKIRFGAGRLVLGPGDEGALYRMGLRYDEDSFEPVAEYRGNRLDLGLKGTGRSTRWRRQEPQEMELSLARGVPMNLELEFGAVRAELDLGGILLKRLDLSTGASESQVVISEPNGMRMSSAGFKVGAADFRIHKLGNLNAERITVDAGVGRVVLDFDGHWQGDATLSVDMGLGSLELRFPTGLGVHLVKNTFLTSLDSEGLVKRGNSYYSLDWEEAEHRVTVNVDAAFGSINVVWVR